MAEDFLGGVHGRLVERAPRILRYDVGDYFPEWQSAVRRSFKQLLGLMPGRVGLEARVVSEEEAVGHRVVRFEFRAEMGAEVEAVLRVPKGVSGKAPVVMWFKADGAAGEFLEPLADGVAVLSFDLRDAGGRKERGGADGAMAALLLGRTMMGERVFDISRAIDALGEMFGEVVDVAKIAVVGGAEAYYAAAFEPRIVGVMCSGVAAYKDTLAVRGFGTEAYIPNLLHYFEMADLAGLIVPRVLGVVAREGEALFPAAAVGECFAEMERIYANQNAAGACRLMSCAAGARGAALWQGFGALLNWRG